jgi:cyclophilin family peptidyl-prolyl cis-trans isomerase
MKKIIYLTLGLVIILGLSGCAAPGEQKPDMNKGNNPASQNSSPDTSYIDSKINANQNTGSDNNQTNNQAKNMDQNDLDYVKNYTGAILKTNFGNITVKFRNTETPNTVNNFLKLANQKFYDGVKFHRVIKGFMIQGGDPNSKDDDWTNDGTGGPGYKFADELAGNEKYPQGTLAMANSGSNTNGSQFFIVTASPSYPLPPNYTVFGQVTSGLDTALKIENVKTNANDHPTENVMINSIELVK